MKKDNPKTLSQIHCCDLKMAVEDLRASSTPFSLSFSGSGFLALYQVGVVQSLLELAPELLKSACKVYGSSAGSLIAAAVVCGVGLGKKTPPRVPPGVLCSINPGVMPRGAGGRWGWWNSPRSPGITETQGVATLGSQCSAVLGGVS